MREYIIVPIPRINNITARIPPYSRAMGLDSGMNPMVNPDIVRSIPANAMMIEPRNFCRIVPTFM